MRITILIAFILFLSKGLFAQDESSNRALCNRLNDLNTAILNGSIKKADAAKQFKLLILQFSDSAPISDNLSWVFPLKGYNYHAIGGTNGNGYSDKGYHYLDGNKHAAHPAHDIFIRDKNQDGIDDKMHQPVNVLAVEDGVVIACTNEWEPTSNLRGGKYIWIYHPQSKIFTYYAHNRAIFVKPGDMVKQGQKIAEVGRTGFNAYPKRSPTHLHFSAFHLINGLPVPYNPYLQLTKAESK
jgi:murein DD-endopeptidase MepM/ murein hydrolase activator NlpD